MNKKGKIAKYIKKSKLAYATNKVKKYKKFRHTYI